MPQVSNSSCCELKHFPAAPGSRQSTLIWNHYRTENKSIHRFRTRFMGRALVVTAGITAPALLGIGKSQRSGAGLREAKRRKKKNHESSPTSIQRKESQGKQVWEGRWQIHNDLIWRKRDLTASSRGTNSRCPIPRSSSTRHAYSFTSLPLSSCMSWDFLTGGVSLAAGVLQGTPSSISSK